MTDSAFEGASAPARPGLRVQRPSRKLLLSALALLAGFAAAFYGYRWWTLGRFLETTDDAYVGGNVTEIAPHVAGFVREILVADNQPVRRGELLLRLDDRDFLAAQARARALLREREATLESLVAKYAMQQSQIRQAEADRAAKIARAAFAREDATRYASLARTRFGSRQEAQRTLAAAREAASEVESAAAKRAAERQGLAVLDSEIAAAKAAAAEAEAGLERASLDLGYTLIRSPIDGYVGHRAAQIGAFVSPGTYLLAVVPAQGLWVDANFKEDALAAMRRGEPATIVADAMPGHAFRGYVMSLAPATGAVFSVIPPENATGNFTKIVQRVPVRIALDGGDGRLGLLRPGLSARVTVDTREPAE
jgi:membrane fusion protein, multidrug efflux system